MTDKHTLSLYYGIDENLPDDIFYREIKLINIQFEEKEVITYERYPNRYWSMHNAQC